MSKECAGEDPWRSALGAGSGCLDEVEGPSPEDLASIEDEWPLIVAEMDLVFAEIAVLTVEPHPTEMDWRRLRRAEARFLGEARALHARLSRPLAARAA